MSLLIHSLLAASLLVTVIRADPCFTRTIGYKTGRPFPLSQVLIPFPGATVNMPLDQCRIAFPDSNGPYGETITACNKDSNGMAPAITNPEGLSPIYVTCVDGCMQNATMDFIFYC